MFWRIVGFLLLAALLMGGLWYSQRESDTLIVSGFVESDEIRLGSRVGGRVRSVFVEEGQQVKAGDVLVELEPFDLLDRRAQAAAFWTQQKARYDEVHAGYRSEEIAQAQARYEQSNEQLRMLRNGPREQELKVAQAELSMSAAELQLATESLSRVSRLQEQGAATQEALDSAVSQQKAATDRVTARREQLAPLQAGTREEEIAMAEARVREAEQSWKLLKNGYREEEVTQAYSAMKAAESALAAIDRQIEELKVRAPAAGHIEAIDLRPGDLVAANAPIVSMLDTDRLWVRAYAPENHLDISTGDKLPLRIDSFPERTFQGEVTFIARQAEFTPNNVQTPEERSKQVFRVKITLLDGHDVLRPGMAADVYLEGTP